MAIVRSYVLDNSAGGVRVTCGLITMLDGAVSELGIEGHSPDATLTFSREVTLAGTAGILNGEFLGDQIDFASTEATDDCRIHWRLEG